MALMGWTPPDGIDVPEWWCEDHRREASVTEVSTIGLDLAKTVFQDRLPGPRCRCCRCGRVPPEGLSRCRTRPQENLLWSVSGGHASRTAPRRERLGLEQPVRRSGDQVTRNREDVVGGRVHRQEPLS